MLSRIAHSCFQTLRWLLFFCGGCSERAEDSKMSRSVSSLSLLYAEILQRCDLNAVQDCPCLSLPCFSLFVQDRDISHRQSPRRDSVVGVGDSSKEAEGCVDQLMSLGDGEAANNSSAFEQWDSYWEDLTRYLLDLRLFFTQPALQADTH